MVPWRLSVASALLLGNLLHGQELGHSHDRLTQDMGPMGPIGSTRMSMIMGVMITEVNTVNTVNTLVTVATVMKRMVWR